MNPFLFLTKDVALGNASVISTIIPTVSLPSVSSTRVDVSAKLESLKAGLPNAPTLPSLMDAASSGLPGSLFLLTHQLMTGSSVGEVLNGYFGLRYCCRYGIFVRLLPMRNSLPAGKVKMAVGGRKEDFTISKVGDSGEWNITGTGIGTDTLSGFAFRV